MPKPEVPCPAELVPDGTKLNEFNRAYQAAKAAKTVFVCVARSGTRWTVKLDALTAPGHSVEEGAAEAVRDAVVTLVRTREAGSGASSGPTYVVLHKLPSEERARELASALHAALYGNTAPLEAALLPA